jgi:hypothetical protein
MTPSTNGRSAHSKRVQDAEPSTTSGGPPETSTVRPNERSATGSSESSMVASNTTATTTNTPHGHTANPAPKTSPLDEMQPVVSRSIRKQCFPSGVHSRADPVGRRRKRRRIRPSEPPIRSRFAHVARRIPTIGIATARQQLAASTRQPLVEAAWFRPVHAMNQPPLTSSVTPVTNEACLLARKPTTAATS